MNPVERDIRGYFGIAPEDSILEHYGTKRHSGRYPWGLARIRISAQVIFCHVLRS